MKNNSLIAFLLLAALPLINSSCEKTDPSLTGTESVADFSFVENPAVSDTLPYPIAITFTNNSTEAFMYQWNFGDNTSLSGVANPVHYYAGGGTYDVRLTSVGSNGNNSVTKKLYIEGACQFDFFKKLAECGNTTQWTWSNDGDAIKVWSPDATQVYFAGAAASCQVDDIYTFGADGSLTYNANGTTFDVQSGYSCQPDIPNAKKFHVVVKAGQKPEIILDAIEGSNRFPFIGTNDKIAGNKYTVMSYDDNNMTLRGTLSDGALLDVKLKKVVNLTLDQILAKLSAHPWKLDAADAAPIVVGIEASPTAYFAGGPLADCQMDDEYSFSADKKISYNANGSTFIAPPYSCGEDLSYNNIDFTYGAVSGVAGIAQFRLPLTTNIFFGTTDSPNGVNLYRILEISDTKMIVRAGDGSGTIWTMKFIAK
jgi:PKD repeat protein